jgi:hypothetical protein
MSAQAFTNAAVAEAAKGARQLMAPEFARGVLIFGVGFTKGFLWIGIGMAAQSNLLFPRKSILP